MVSIRVAARQDICLIFQHAAAPGGRQSGAEKMTLQTATTQRS